MDKFVNGDRVAVRNTGDDEFDGMTGTVCGVYGKDFVVPLYVVMLDATYSKIPEWSAHLLPGTCLSKNG